MLSNKPKRINSANLSINTVTNTSVDNSGQSKEMPTSPLLPSIVPLNLSLQTPMSDIRPNSPLKSSPQRETFNSMPYKRGPVEILPGLFLGSERNAKDKESLVQLNITAILNVGEECRNLYNTELSETPSSSKSTMSPIYNPLNIVSSEESLDRHFSHHATISSVPHSAATSSGSHSSLPYAMRYKHLPWSHNQDDIRTHLDEALAFIDETLKNNNTQSGDDRPEGVLVHCKQGVSRSATLVIAYVMKATGMSMNEAYSMVKEKSPVISPNLVLIYQLNEYEKELRNQR